MSMLLALTHLRVADRAAARWSRGPHAASASMHAQRTLAARTDADAHLADRIGDLRRVV